MDVLRPGLSFFCTPVTRGLWLLRQARLLFVELLNTCAVACIQVWRQAANSRTSLLPAAMPRIRTLQLGRALPSGTRPLAKTLATSLGCSGVLPVGGNCRA